MQKPGLTSPPAARPGGAEEIAEGVRVVTAPNGGPMTFTGTRSYFVGQGDVGVIDPGPADTTHLKNLLSALQPGERISHILVTHSHVDHSQLASELSRTTGAPILAFGKFSDGRSDRMKKLAGVRYLGGGEGVDTSFEPDIRLADGEMVAGQNWALEALHTPGHLSNHLCFALRGGEFIFTGDHVMGWSTTLVSPPDGDMADFMKSLGRLIERPENVYLPGHGPLLREGRKLAREHLAHRLEREAQILAALSSSSKSPEGIVSHVYEGLAPHLGLAAARNVLAHLIDLTDRKSVRAHEVSPGKFEYCLI